MKAKRLFLLLGILLLAGGGFAYWSLFVSDDHSDKQIRVSGNIETTEVQIAFKIAGRVVERCFDEGQKVKAGEIVAKLDTADLQCNVDLRKAEYDVAAAAYAALKAGSRPQEIEAARAAFEKADHALADLLVGSRPQEIAAAKAALASAAADVDRSEADFRRSTTLFERKTISAEEYDAVKAAREIAVQKYNESKEQLSLVQEGPRKEQIKEARSTLDQANAQYELVKIGPRQEDIDQGRERVKQALAAWNLARTELGYATVRSPLSGVVLSKNIEPGEYVAPGTAVVTVGDLNNVWLRAYIVGDDLQRVKVGQRAWIIADSSRGSDGKRYEGRVSFIAEEAEFTPKNVETQKERVKLVYRIKINVDNPKWELKPGMPVDAVVEIGGEARGKKD
jgi:HlyD family secretion protein